MSLDRVRLARLLGMLGSAHDGEIANAGRMAARLIKDAKTTWLELLKPEGDRDHELQIATTAGQGLLDENERLQAEVMRLRGRTPDIPATWQEPTNETEAIETASVWVAFLTDWERGFVTSLTGWRGSLTPKQQERLRELNRKIARIARAHGRAE
jgi:hypothetical protein